MNNKSNTEKFCGGFAVHERRFFFIYHIKNERRRKI
jgi:hypothetical protein